MILNKIEVACDDIIVTMSKSFFQLANIFKI